MLCFQTNVRWLLPNIFVLLVFAFGGGLFSGLFRLKWLKRLGDLSFECFLTHKMIITLYYCANIGGESKLSNLFRLVFVFGTTVLLALLLNKKPASIQKQTN